MVGACSPAVSVGGPSGNQRSFAQFGARDLSTQIKVVNRGAHKNRPKAIKAKKKGPAIAPGQMSQGGGGAGAAPGSALECWGEPLPLRGVRDENMHSLCQHLNWPAKAVVTGYGVEAVAGDVKSLFHRW